jgi:glutathione S-transferase
MLANEDVRALAWARVAVLMKQPRDTLPELQREGRAGLTALEGHLRGRAWLAADHITIADVACFPYVGLAPQGEVSLAEYPAVRAWIARIKAMPNYVPMPGLE